MSAETAIMPDLPSTAAINLRRLVALRAIALAGQLLAVWAASGPLGFELPLRSLVAVIAAMAVVNLFTAWRLKRPRAVSERELFAHLVLDVAALTALLYLSGGATNPFVMLYLLPLALTAAALPAAYAWAMVAVTILCYTLLLFFYVPLSAGHGGHEAGFALHVFGMWLGFVLSAALIARFAVRMSETRASRDRLLARMREEELKNERVVALGTLAAGAVHELATPLATMAVVVKDLAPGQPLAAARLETLRAQIARCKEILGSLSATAGAARAEGGSRQPLDRWLEELVRRWQAVRPGVKVDLRLAGERPAPWIVAESTLAQAITNILNNAADASPESVEVEGRWNEEALVLEVADRGPGLAPEIREAVGEVPVTTKAPQGGLGLGLFLAFTTLSRFGGTVRLAEREGGGARCLLRLPLATLKLSS
jgi:two-component system sensor histidine kinase RegB